MHSTYLTSESYSMLRDEINKLNIAFLNLRKLLPKLWLSLQESVDMQMWSPRNRAEGVLGRGAEDCSGGWCKQDCIL